MLLILAPQFPPAVKAGGPVKTLYIFSRLLQEKGYEYSVVTKDIDLDGTPLDSADFVDGADYLKKIRIGELRKRFRTSKVIWLNTLYSVPFSIFPLIALFGIKKRTVLVSPRGQLLSGAMSFKKRVFLWFFRNGLKLSGHRVLIHYTNPQEQENSLPLLKGFEEVIFNNPLTGEITEKSSGSDLSATKLAYFGRISPIKNLGFLLEILAELPANFSLELHGALEDEAYIKQLKQVIDKSGLSGRVSFEGAYTKDDFLEKVSPQGIGLIPSFSENFCHVFFELIEARKMVIASNGLPWEAINQQVSNTVLPLQKEQWKNRILEISELSITDYTAQQDKLLYFYQQIKNDIEADFLAVLDSLIEYEDLKG